MTTKTETAPEFDWSSIIEKSVDAWPEPDNLPTGFWQFRIKAAKVDKSKGSFSLVLAPTQPVSGVDEDEVAALNGQLETMVVFTRFNLARHDQVVQAKAFVRSMGLGEYGLEDASKALKGTDVQGEVTHAPKNKDNPEEGVWVNVRRLGPVS